jgi:hypothetical protein
VRTSERARRAIEQLAAIRSLIAENLRHAGDCSADGRRLRSLIDATNQVTFERH